jgi:predicted outer membrane repeat protein
VTRPTLAVLLLSFAPAAATAVDCAPAGVVCVPEESSLSAALLSVAHGGTIDIAPGTYPSPTDGFTIGTTTQQRDRSFTVRARTPGTVILTGQNARRVLSIRNLAAGRWLTFEGLRFENGFTDAPDFAGGVSLRNARATFADCEFRGHRGGASSNGGGALGLYGSATALVVDALFENNRTIREGGAIFAQKGGAAPNDQPSEVWLVRATLRDNCETNDLANCTTGDAAGGAVLVRNSRAYIADSRFENNVAGWVGGAVYAFGHFACNSPFCASPAADVLITRTTFVGNRAAGSNAPAGFTQAGAIHVEDCVRLRVHQAIFDGNSAGWAGAIQSFRAQLEVYDSVFRGNRATAAGTTAAQGGAILALSGAASAIGCSSGQTRNYPAASVRIERSLLQGSSTAAAEAQISGCLGVAGDNPDSGSGACQSSQTTRCAQLTVVDSALFDCAVAKLGTQDFVFGGGFSVGRTFATFTDVLLARNSAGGTSTCPQGGAGSVRDDAVLAMNDVLFSGNSATCLANDLQLITGGATQETNVRYYLASQASPVDGKLIAAPSQRVAATDGFDPQTWLVHGWSGDSAALDGVALGGSPRNGVVAGGVGSHGLVVEPGGFFNGDAVAAAPVPVTTLAAAPFCPSGGTTLSWTTPAGELLAAFVDQGVAGSTGSGSAAVSPAGTTAYRRVVLTRQGGAVADATVYIGACPLIFEDGFDAGDTGRWSVTSP